MKFVGVLTAAGFAPEEVQTTARLTLELRVAI